MSRKIMYKKINNEERYALPTNLNELKLLVWDGWCVMNFKEIDLHDYFREDDWYKGDGYYEYHELVDYFDENLRYMSVSYIADIKHFKAAEGEWERITLESWTE